ncbi:MAG: hypothetical protein GY863_09870 [bacterium]|nr:hypothetical protein [bacterium]
MKHLIGETAGRIWQIVSDRGEVNISGLPKILNEKSPIVYQALGWLAREEKIEYHKEGKQTLICISN